MTLKCVRLKNSVSQRNKRPLESRQGLEENRTCVYCVQLETLDTFENAAACGDDEFQRRNKEHGTWNDNLPDTIGLSCLSLSECYFGFLF